MVKKTLNIDLNRVEGDLEFELDIEDGIVVDARCIGVMYRGFEQIMIGRMPRDAAVITPRVCGICGTAHLYAATLALEQIWGIRPPPNATYIRNLCLLTESIQNDIRQSFLMFLVDFCHQAYRDHPLYNHIMAGFEPFKGRHHLGALEQSRDAVGIIALFGGQWPHSSYMLPGGVVSKPTHRKLIEATNIITGLTRWYENAVIGDSLENWLDLNSRDAFFNWMEKDQKRADSALGIFTRFSRDIGLHEIGFGSENLISYGVMSDSLNGGEYAMPPGVYDAGNKTISPLDQSLITEHVRYSWFRQYPGGRHPFKGETIPDYQTESDRYTWAKAPRYDGKVMQTGPLAELVIGADPLITDFHQREGASTWLRQFSRLRRIGHSLVQMKQLVKTLSADIDGEFFLPPKPEDEVDGKGFGMIQAARGGLGHWVSVKDGVVESYQIITPTAWNASPRDADGNHGHWEQSVIGLKVDDLENPLTISHVIRSHDPCLVCTVHMLPTGKSVRFGL
ncbi:nickel-dependent hydrogenase large subunit [Enterovibrio paralichthyis]|uniref:nickel-dependent hydrogenase large subunit n=1 Tax=Enterovibrio paralichthyis TaxID=2853805 RepID=UPI001C46DA2C|nr:nickel-dependent hydrogenase large subunit [Enterovibrio paralichthyis]MBV7296808.1 nickel-dependent hydrogenase large subunit [Enterovibrio paralichthyis]